MFSGFEVSRGGFLFVFWGVSGYFSFLKILLLSVWCRSVNVLYLSNACISDILCRNSQPCSEGFFCSFTWKKIWISVRTESFQQITLGSGSNISQSQEPFSFFWQFCFLLLTCVILSMFSGFEVSRGGFFVCFRENFGIICVFKAFLLSVWDRSVNTLCLSNECLHDMLGGNKRTCGQV